MTRAGDFVDLFSEGKGFFFDVIKRVNDDLKHRYLTNDYKMMVLLKKLGRTQLKDIADFVGSKPLACTQLGNLERKKMVLREVDPKNKRNVYYLISPSGEKYVGQMMKEIRVSLGKIFSNLSAKDMSDFAAALKTLNAIMAKAVK